VTAGPVDVVFRVADPTSDVVTDLLAAMVAEVSEMYGPIDGPGGSHLSTDELFLPRGAYLVGWVGEESVAGGALRRLDEPDLVEIKRMYVRPERRGEGLATQLLAALEGQARTMGYTRARLDTGPHQVHARRLYEHSGYVEIPDYNGNRHATYWAEKDLTG
jgi:GNAT superfamily N-acetyltransferase